MHIQIDQSGRVEQPVNTVLAFSNSVDYAILIPRGVKRVVAQYLREEASKDKERTALIIFSVGVFLLIRDFLPQLQSVEIDEEFTGKEADVKAILLRTARRSGLVLPRHLLAFGRIGKKAGAHKRAIAITRGKSKPDRVVSEDEMFALIK